MTSQLRRSHSVRVVSHDDSDVDLLRALARNAHAGFDDHEDFLHLVAVGALELDGPSPGHVRLAAEPWAGTAVPGSVLLGGSAAVQLQVLRFLGAPSLLALFQGLFLMRSWHVTGANLAVSDDFSQVALAVPAVYSLAEADAALLLRAVAPLSVLSHALVVEKSQLGGLLLRVAC